MLIEKVKVRIRCELGACKERAAHTIRLARVGIRSRIHVCELCLKELAEVIKTVYPEKAAEVVKVETKKDDKPPKSIETLKPKRKSVKDTTVSICNK